MSFYLVLNRNESTFGCNGNSQELSLFSECIKALIFSSCNLEDYTIYEISKNGSHNIINDDVVIPFTLTLKLKNKDDERKIELVNTSLHPEQVDIIYTNRMGIRKIFNNFQDYITYVIENQLDDLIGVG